MMIVGVGRFISAPTFMHDGCMCDYRGMEQAAC